MIIKKKLYLHRSKEDNWYAWDEIFEETHPEAAGSSDTEAGREFAYTLLEVEVDVEIDTETGEAKVTHYDGHPLVTQQELDNLRDSERKLYALEACGVDNWEGYGEAMRDYYGDSE